MSLATRSVCYAYALQLGFVKLREFIVGFSFWVWVIQKAHVSFNPIAFGFGPGSFFHFFYHNSWKIVVDTFDRAEKHI